jgi:predicted enzyme related to lactoylglutathione lyase
MSTAQHQIGIESLDIIPIVVSDLDEAIEFYTETLGFEVRMDDEFEMEGEAGRWVTIGLPGDDLQIALTPADEPYYDDDTRDALAAKLGSQTWYTFRTDDCAASVVALENAGVEITREPMAYPWGIEAMFADPFGNEFSVFEYVED